jgi:hypothetical protein
MQFPAFLKSGRVVLIACLAAFGTGCSDGSDRDSWDTPPSLASNTVPATVAIDTGATITAQPGGGVGVFVQYSPGGHWSARTSCDTPTSNASCGFDLYFSGLGASTVLSNPQGQDVAGADTVDMLADGSLHLFANTSNALDGFTFDASPGATLQLDMFLDGVEQPRFVYWIGQSVLHTGAPTDPINFTPTAP